MFQDRYARRANIWKNAGYYVWLLTAAKARLTSQPGKRNLDEQSGGTSRWYVSAALVVPRTSAV